MSGSGGSGLAVAVGTMLCAGGAADGAADPAGRTAFALVEGCPAADGEAAGFVFLESPLPVEAYSIAIRYEPHLAELLDLSIAGTVAEALGAGYASTVSGEDGRGGYAVLGVLMMDPATGGGETIPAGAGVPIASLRLRARDPAARAVPVAFEDGVGRRSAEGLNRVVQRVGVELYEVDPERDGDGLPVARARLRGLDRPAAPGEEVGLPVLLDAGLAVASLRFALRYPPDLLTFLGIETSGTAPAGTGCAWSVEDPDPGAGRCAFRIRCEGPESVAIPAGEGIEIGRVRFQVVEPAASGTGVPARIEIAFEEGGAAVRFSGPAGSCGDTRPATEPFAVCTTAPRAEVAASPAVGYAPLAVVLRDVSLGPVEIRAWSFGDGEAARDAPAEVRHVYGPGRFRAALAVANGCASDRAEVAIESRVRVEIGPAPDAPADDPPGWGHRPGDRGVVIARVAVDAGLPEPVGLVVSGLRVRDAAGSSGPGIPTEPRRWVERVAVYRDGNEGTGGPIAEATAFRADGVAYLADRVPLVVPGRYRLQIDLAATPGGSAPVKPASTRPSGPSPGLVLLLGAAALAALLGRLGAAIRRAPSAVARAGLCAAVAILCAVPWYAGCGGGGGGGGAPAFEPAEQGILALELEWDGVEWEGATGLADATVSSIRCAAIRLPAP